MKKGELKRIIKNSVLNKVRNQNHEKIVLSKDKGLKDVIKDLLTSDYSIFIENVKWVSPNPKTYRVELVNKQSFYLTDKDKSWIAQVEGRKFYLKNLSEYQRACEAITNILKVGPVLSGTDLFDSESDTEKSLNTGSGSSFSSGGTDMEDMLDTEEEPVPGDDSEVDYSEFTDEPE